MRIVRTGVLLLLALGLAGCEPPYHRHVPILTLTGFTDEKLSDDVWNVKYTGGQSSSRHTISTYWLYRCAELTLEQNYDGFHVLTNMNLGSSGSGEDGVQVAARGSVPIIIQGPPTILYYMEGRIRLLKRPFHPDDKPRYDAARLKAFLDPIVNGEKCRGGNVCPYPRGHLESE
jgi:hypothetical protein